jgi:choline transport protein
VESRTSIPIVAILFTAIFSILVDLIDLGSSTVLNDIISLTINSVYGSYLLSSALILWRRFTGGIADRHSVTSPFKLSWGPWHVPGVLGILKNAYACIWMLIVLFFTSWPPKTPVTASTMNYSIFLTIFVALFSAVYYVVWGKTNYNGPVVETVLPAESSMIRVTSS